MKNQRLKITEASRLIGVSAQTLRRWDQSGELSGERSKQGGFRYYQISDLEHIVEDRQLDIEKLAESWVFGDGTWTPLDVFYCATSNIFQLRLKILESTLDHFKGIEKLFTLITSSVGEIGDNSFDHNLGNWPDVPGIFFGFDAKRRKVVLADRGQGVLKTISRARPSLNTHTAALAVAFTEVLTGRSPEHRGNGLKYVRKIITANSFSLTFQTGDARLELSQGDQELRIKKTREIISGCFATIVF